jgi:hypothetical protein
MLATGAPEMSARSRRAAAQAVAFDGEIEISNEYNRGDLVHQESRVGAL